MLKYVTKCRQITNDRNVNITALLGHNISFSTFWEPKRWWHSKSSGFHDPHMTFANSELQPGPPKRSKNNPQTKQMQQLSASPSQLEAETAPDQCPADAIPLSSRARPRVVPRCSVGCPATASKKHQKWSAGAGRRFQEVARGDTRIL